MHPFRSSEINVIGCIFVLLTTVDVVALQQV